MVKFYFIYPATDSRIEFYVCDNQGDLPTSGLQIGSLAVTKDANKLWQAISTTQWAEKGSGGAAVWGSITGTLADQTDLKDALDAKAPSSQGVTNGNSHDHLGGDGAQIAHTSLGSVTADQHHAQVHNLGGSDHGADTLANLNAKISDADVIAFAGQIGGTAASPDVRGLRETSGPQLLTIAAISDGQYLLRTGNTITGGAGGSGLDHGQTMSRIFMQV